MASLARDTHVSSRPKRACTEGIVFRESSLDSDDSGEQPRRRRRHFATEPPRREKNGCLTCRIRHKKCHGRTPDSEHCQDCLRLGIECLGWSEKRPDWLRQSVPEKVRQIKEDLLARNMIKGARKIGTPRPSSVSDLAEEDDDVRDDRLSPGSVDESDSSTSGSTAFDDLPPLAHTVQALNDTLGLVQPSFHGETEFYSYEQDTIIFEADQWQSNFPLPESNAYEDAHFYDQALYGQSRFDVHDTTSMMAPHYDIGGDTTGYPPSDAPFDLSWHPTSSHSA